jgi:hypothetical protein
MRVAVRFYEELNHYLPETVHKREFSLELPDQSTVGDLIALAGVPVEAVDLVLVEGQSAGFDFQLEEAQRVSIFPVFESIDITGVTRVRRTPLRRLSFIADDTLPGLCRALWNLGVDCFQSDTDNPEIFFRHCSEDNRIILTHNPKRFRSAKFQRVFRIKSQRTELQLKEVLDRFDLKIVG